MTPTEIASVTRLNNFLTEVRNQPTPGHRFAKMRNEWDRTVVANLRTLPQNENTFSGTLTTQFLADGAITQLQHLLCPLMAFTRQFETDRYKPRATGQLKFVTGGSTVQTNPTNFEQGDSVVTNIQVAVNQYSQPFHVTNDQLNSGLRMADLAFMNAKLFANKIIEVATTPLTKAAYASPASIAKAVSAFDWTTMSTAWGNIKKSPIKYAVLDGEYLGKLINQPSFYQRTPGDAGQSGWRTFGWDGIYENTDWTATPSGDFIRGVFCNPQAVGVLAGLPLVPPGAGRVMESQEEVVPDVGVSFQTNSWLSLASRTWWTSYDIMLGASQGDTVAACLLTSQ